MQTQRRRYAEARAEAEDAQLNSQELPVLSHEKPLVRMHSKSGTLENFSAPLPSAADHLQDRGIRAGWSAPLDEEADDQMPATPGSARKNLQPGRTSKRDMLPQRGPHRAPRGGRSRSSDGGRPVVSMVPSGRVMARVLSVLPEGPEGSEVTPPTPKGARASREPFAIPPPAAKYEAAPTAGGQSVSLQLGEPERTPPLPPHRVTRAGDSGLAPQLVRSCSDSVVFAGGSSRTPPIIKSDSPDLAPAQTHSPTQHTEAEDAPCSSGRQAADRAPVDPRQVLLRAKTHGRVTTLPAHRGPATPADLLGQTTSNATASTGTEENQFGLDSLTFMPPSALPLPEAVLEQSHRSTSSSHRSGSGRKDLATNAVHPSTAQSLRRGRSLKDARLARHTVTLGTSGLHAGRSAAEHWHTAGATGRASFARRATAPHESASSMRWYASHDALKATTLLCGSCGLHLLGLRYSRWCGAGVVVDAAVSRGAPSLCQPCVSVARAAVQLHSISHKMCERVQAEQVQPNDDRQRQGASPAVAPVSHRARATCNCIPGSHL